MLVKYILKTHSTPEGEGNLLVLKLGTRGTVWKGCVAGEFQSFAAKITWLQFRARGTTAQFQFFEEPAISFIRDQVNSTIIRKMWVLFWFHHRSSPNTYKDWSTVQFVPSFSGSSAGKSNPWEQNSHLNTEPASSGQQVFEAWSKKLQPSLSSVNETLETIFWASSWFIQFLHSKHGTYNSI